MKPQLCLFEPASPTDPIFLEEALKRFETEFPQHERFSIKIVGQTGQPNPLLPYLASDDDTKARAFSSLILECNEHTFVILTRGGYGTMRWLHKVDFDNLTNHLDNLLFIGFSDATFLACRLLKWGKQFLHAPMLSTLPTTDTKSRTALYDFLANGRLSELKGETLNPGHAEGTLVGGNLTCLCHTIGTSFEPDWTDKILFIEDCGEEIYRLDRMLTHLLLRGVLDRVKGVVTGKFLLKKEEQNREEMLIRLLEDRLGSIKKPVIINLPAGHGEKNIPMLIGSEYEIDGKNALLRPCQCQYEFS